MKTRRGISSVVGMVFAIIAIVTTVGYVTFSLNVLDSFNQSVLARNQMTLDASKEKFDLYSIKVVNNKFNVTISNSGNLPINITRMWVQNTTNPALDWTNYYSINRLVPPGGLLTNIGQSSPVSALLTQTYNLKLVTGRGNSMQFSMGSPGVKPLYLQAEFIPNSIHTSNNATFLLIVINNMTSSNMLTNLQPNLPSCSGSATATLMGSAGPVPTQYPYLQSGGTAIFKWVFKVSGTTGQSATCTASLKGASSNTASDIVWINNF
jgi:hypothetical protein